MIKKLEINELSEVREKETIGFPRSPGYWAGKEEYKKVTIITMTCGGGLGGSKWEEIVEYVSQTVLSNHMEKGKPLSVTTYDGRKILINLNYMVKAENFTIVEKKFYSNNTNFETGLYTCRWLLPLDEKVRFVDHY